MAAGFCSCPRVLSCCLNSPSCCTAQLRSCGISRIACIPPPESGSAGLDLRELKGYTGDKQAPEHLGMKAEPARRSTLVGAVADSALRFTTASDLQCDLELVEYDCIGTAAHVLALARLKLLHPVLTETEARKVIRSLVQIMQAHRRGQFKITAADQDVHLALERVLTERLGELGQKVHTGRSRNDQAALDMRLYLKDRLLEIILQVAETAGVLLRRAGRYRNTPMVGRTHMQPAMPSTVGLWLASFAEALLEDSTELRMVYEMADRCPLGAGAGYGVPLELDREYEARLLGFREPIVNVLYAVSGRGKLEARAISALGQVMLTLSALASDLIFYSLPEIGYVDLPEEMCTGSSIMPQKRNPDILELIRARAAVVAGWSLSAAEIVRALPSGYQRDFQEIKPLLMGAVATTGSALGITAEVVAKMGINTEALRCGFTPEVFATDVALNMVAEGTPFRRAYQAVREHLKEVGPIDPAAAIRRRRSSGSPGNLRLELLRQRVGELGGWVRQNRRRFYRAISRLLGVEYPSLNAQRSARSN